MHIGARLWRRDPLTLAVGERRASIEAYGELAAHEWTTALHAHPVAGIDCARLVLEHTDLDRDARLPEGFDSSARNSRVRIASRADDARDIGSNQRIRARPGSARMIARLERHIDRRTARGCTRSIDGHALGMRTAGGRSPALTDDVILGDEHATHARIWIGRIKTVASQLERAVHVL